MKYSVEIFAIKDNVIEARAKTYNFESKTHLNKNTISQLLKEAIEFFKKENKTLENKLLVVNKLDFSCIAIEKEFKEIPRELEEIYNTSKKEYMEYIDTKEWKTEQLFQMMESALSNLKQLRKSAIELNVLDSQEWINYQDELNKLSIDPDRK